MDGLTTAIVTVTAFAVTDALGIWMIPFLHKLKYGQTILDIGPSWHKNKQGTPTMGGLMFIVGILVACAAGFALYATRSGGFTPIQRMENAKFAAGLLMAAAFGFIGFLDDYVKVSKKQNLGLTPSQKLVLQFGVAAFYLVSIRLSGDATTALPIPFFGYFDFGIFYYPLAAVGIVYITNSVNLTDGLDGLASSVTLMASLGFLVMGRMLGVVPAELMAAATAGGCVGFLVWNFYPAKVFMGDTGSMFLGGLVVAMAFSIGSPLILAFVGIIYIVESLSVVLQVISFKTTGKRIFKMSPIHHHFEMSGYSEVQIVAAFSLVTAVGAALAVFSIARL